MALVTIQRHDGMNLCTQDIDSAELKAFMDAGWEVAAEKPAEPGKSKAK